MAKDEIEPTGTTHALGYDGDSLDKKESRDIKDVSVQAAGDFYDVEGTHGIAAVEHDLNVTEKDALEAEEKMGKLDLDEVREIMQEVLLSHEHDQNFPATVIQRIREFLDNDEVFTHPHLHAGLINEMKLEAILVTENSPYAEVRAVVDNTDNVDEPASTLRAWLIGTIFVVAGAFINQLFSIRLPAIKIHANVAQLLAFPCGRILAATLPDKRFRLFGHEVSLNPGPFNRKEHMMITIMANVGFNVPYTENIILTQYLKQFFNQAYATDFAYQILVGLGTNFVGFGLAGLARRFLVWPAYCVWPTSLVTIALNRAFHTEPNIPVAGPFGKTYTWSRMRTFFILFAIMFAYFWFPGFIFPALSTFNWISWIAPNNQVLNNIVGSNNGLGINPLPTFDWNVISYQIDPLVIPWFTTINCFMGMITAGFMIVGMYWTNAYNTGYLPINSNKVFDNMGKSFNVSKVIDSRGIFDDAKYQSYSMPWMAAGNLTIYFWFFAVYSATITYAVLFHRREIWMGLKNVVKRKREADKFEDVHMRLMRNYKEVPEWWFLIVLCCAMACGMAGIGAWQTYTTPAVVIYGIILAIFFVVPVGIIYAITGIQVTLNVLAEFIGGAWVAGNALAMNYFKAFGYITTAQALYFSNDLKLAHYVKIPPRVTFSAQIWAVLVSTFVCTGIFNFQMTKIPNVCTSAAPFGFSCPGVNTFFTAAVFWGTLGPHKLFGLNGQYKEMLIGFPVGFVLVIAGYVAKRIWPRNTWVRMYHPVAFTTGALFWAPYNMTYAWPAVPVAFVTWMIIKPRYLAFWSKYNYIVSAAFASGVAIAGLIIFFGVQLPAVHFEWWGTDQISVGCEGVACRRLPIPDKGYFGPDKGHYVE